VGKNGSGAVFFTGCNLGCVFCQTYEISQEGKGTEISVEQLAWIMRELERQGCHNLNLVTPSHQVPAILRALRLALEEGFSLPVVYNTSSYDKLDTLKALEGIVDIYLADFKVWDPQVAAKYLRAKDYPEVARKAIKEMFRQVGHLVLDEQGLAKKGLIVRHLVLPGGLAGTKEILQFLRDEISPEVYLNLMGHYHPAGEAHKYPPLDRPLKKREYEEALKLAREMGFTNLDQTHLPLLDLLLTDD